MRRGAADAEVLEFEDAAAMAAEASAPEKEGIAGCNAGLT